MDVKIALSIMQSAIPQPGAHQERKKTVLEKVRDFILDVESGCDDKSHQWGYLKAIFLNLHKKKHLSEMEKDLLSLVEPCIMKYCEFDSELGPAIEGYQLNKYKEDRNA
jgi:hypothetical protein